MHVCTRTKYAVHSRLRIKTRNMAADVFDKFTFLCILVIFSMTVGEEKPKLFTIDDDVIILNSTNFDKSLQLSQQFWMVNFYNSWCGHCVVFAPTWKQFATDIKNWRAIVRIGAIDCSDQANLATCRESNVSGYPTLLTYSPLTKNLYGKNVSRTSYHGDRRLGYMRQYILNYITENHDGQDTLATKLLHPLKNLEHIWQHVNQDVKYVAVIFEDEDSYIGRELILDMLAYKELVLRRMLKKDVIMYGIKTFPSMYLIQKDGTFHNPSSTGIEREDFRQALRQLLNLPPEKSDNSLSEDDGQGAGVGVESNISPTIPEDGVYVEDLLSAVSYSLSHEIAATKLIDGEALSALKLYILVLSKYLPVPDQHQRFLEEVSGWLHGIDTLDGAEWLKKIHQIQETSTYIPLDTHYVGCRGSQSRYRGYPCSMWVMFHTLTVTSVTQHDSDSTFDPQEVLVAMRGYITHFFGCRECSVHFNKGAKYIEERISKPDDAILYLWIMHNRANFRLHGDVTEDPEHPKIQFPSRLSCPDCYSDDQLQDGKPNWNEEAVLNFLKNHYSRDKILRKTKDFKLDEQIDSPVEEKVDEAEKFGRMSEIEHWRKNDGKRKDDIAKLKDIKAEKMSSNKKEDILYEPKYNKNKIQKLKQVEFDTRISGKAIARVDFSGIDLSMCVIFYMFCTGFIIFGYYHFIVRRGMKPRICCKDLV